MKEVLTMTETDLAAALRHCIDDCGCSWPTACQILSRMTGRTYTLAELQELQCLCGPQIRNRLRICL